MMDKEIDHWNSDTIIEYHKKQFFKPKRSTVAFEKFLTSNVELKGNILDLACGGAL